MLTSDDGRSCLLHLASSYGHVQVVQALVTAGGHELLMLTSDDGLSCLHGASLEGQLEVVKHYRSRGALEGF